MSNNVGKIRGSSVNGRSSIKIDSSNVDITGNLLAKGFITFSQTNEELAYTDPSGIIYRFNSLDNSVNILDNSVNTLLTSNNDACFNNVDVSGTLNVQGEKVMTVPALDICGNDLSANTTYEITTGPVGSINNISFVKKQERYFLSIKLNGNMEVNGTDSLPSHNNGEDAYYTLINWASLAATDSSDFDMNTGIWTCPNTGIYLINCEPTFDHNDDMRKVRVWIQKSTNGSDWPYIRYNEWNSEQGGSGTDDFKVYNPSCSIMHPIQAGEYIRFRISIVGAGQPFRINHHTYAHFMRVD